MLEAAEKAGAHWKDKWDTIAEYYGVKRDTIRKWYGREKQKRALIPIEPQPKPVSKNFKPKETALKMRGSDYWRFIFYLITGKITRGRIKDIIRILITYLENLLAESDP